MHRGLSLAALVILAANAAAEPCQDNFSSDGSFLTGRTYKTWANLPGVRVPDAFNRAYAFTAENGFTVLSANKEAGVISAAQSVSYGKGKSVPLTVTLNNDGASTRVALSYATSGGVTSPEDAIRRHFCMTIAAAGGTASATSNADAAVTSPALNGSIPAPIARPLPRGFALATAEQLQALRREIPKTVPNDRLRPLVIEATPAITSFIEQIACLADHTGASALNEHAAPGTDLAGRYSGLRPMRTMQYHNKAACLTVARVQGWVAPANNALRFEVLYKADDSGETAKLTHELIRQPDGVWLFTQ